ncbi:uncharacterized protein FIBRA_07075 [Fibroporia radiculosa]|uniref:chitin deacetylase n=1 Tax=Fibroporia radiculosa TaxID=599839 RepID=J4IBL7_9APHY|nr:uncharacterized protein FIBRA_07075 [Fibroporia radiculosa]CCM04881.1 predicted protein [Fibroporia radiculosa]
MRFFLSVLLATSYALTAVLAHAPSKTQRRDTWYHDEDHPVHALFRRDPASPTASAAYPSHSPDPSNLPQAWIDALNAAMASGKIPDLPQSTMNPGRDPTYGSLDPNSPQVCSTTYQCKIDGDIWDGPNGTVGAGFDDGPLPPSTKLYSFLKQNNLHATHFMIGLNIVQYRTQFDIAVNTNEDDIAVHTWTHPYMTTLSNLQVLGELGWTMQIIHDLTGGRVPRFWRPPYGDSDVRVHAIALEVFGLTTIMWNYDTNDWALESGGTSMAAIKKSLQKWYGGSKSPGLIILEHELSDQSVEAYIDAFPLIAQNGWDVESVVRLFGGAYKNTSGADAEVGGSILVAEVGGTIGGDGSDGNAGGAGNADTAGAGGGNDSTPNVMAANASPNSPGSHTTEPTHTSGTSNAPTSPNAQKSSSAPWYGTGIVPWIMSLVGLVFAGLTF